MVMKLQLTGIMENIRNREPGARYQETGVVKSVIYPRLLDLATPRPLI
jgi:hypothetical protein